MPSPPPDQAGGGWKLVPYIDPKGRCHVREYLEDLRRSDTGRWLHFLEVVRPTLEKHGPLAVGMPLWRPLKRGLYEIRWGRCRIYCCFGQGRTINMLMGVTKRWDRFPNDHRKTCDGFREEMASVNYDEEGRELRYRNRCQKQNRNEST